MVCAAVGRSQLWHCRLLARWFVRCAGTAAVLWLGVMVVAIAIWLGIYIAIWLGDLDHFQTAPVRVFWIAQSLDRNSVKTLYLRALIATLFIASYKK